MITALLVASLTLVPLAAVLSSLFSDDSGGFAHLASPNLGL